MTAARRNENQYVLGTDLIELERLRFQHKVWLEAAYTLWRRAGISGGDRILDLGCGPGFTSFELADIVGPAGSVIALDKSERFLSFLESECARRGLSQLSARLGDVADLDLARASLDAAYARWLLCWVPDAGRVIDRMTSALRPGGIIVMQEYLDWAAAKLVPRSRTFERIIDACMHSWIDAGATIDICEQIPKLARRSKLSIEYFRPVARLGAVGSLEWNWLTQFFRSYLPRMVERGLLNHSDYQAYRADWNARAEDGGSFVYTPTMADVILKRPDAG